MKKIFFLAALTALLLTVPSFAASLNHMTDTLGLLSEQDDASLESRMEELSNEYQLGFYIVLLDNYLNYTEGDMLDCAAEIYLNYGLGYGPDHDGLLLLISFDDRDYMIYAYGYGNTAYTDYGKDLLAESFLDEFRVNDWVGGFRDYLEEAPEYLTAARNGEPIDVDTRPGLLKILLFVGLLPCAAAGIVCGFLRYRMLSVHTATHAGEYVVPDSLHLRVKQDMFTHTTQTRRKIERKSGGGGGGTTIHSSGGSGRGGKF